MLVVKRFVALTAAVLIAAFATAQSTQSGYVKTKGRMDSTGRIIPGTRIGGAAVQLAGGHSTVADANGNFTLTVPDGKFYLLNVQKQGYVLTDPDVLRKQYFCSDNPLVITMETPQQLLRDQLEAQRKIERTLREQLSERQRELDSLHTLQRITEEEYYQKLQQLYDERASENLVKEMSRRYAAIDFDLVDSFQQQLSVHILNGELDKADSMLNSRGNIMEDIASLDSLRKANAKEATRINDSYHTLDSSIAYERWQQRHLAQLCDDKVETFQQLGQPDSVAYYLQAKAAIDTDNVDWQLAAGRFLSEQLQSYEKALPYYHRALRRTARLYGEGHPKTQALREELKTVQRKPRP